MSIFDTSGWRVAYIDKAGYDDPLGEFKRLFILKKNPDGTKQHVKGFVLEDAPEMTVGYRGYESSTGPEPSDDEELVRAIMNAAWEAGLRPDGFEDAKRETETLKAWLKDMRHLAFKGSPPGAHS